MRRKNLNHHNTKSYIHGCLTNNSWDNTHEDFISMDDKKLYTFYTDSIIEYPFFEKVKAKYSASKYKYKVFNQVADKGICPRCNKKSAFYMSTRDGDSYRVVCANDECSFPNGKSGMLLHEIIMEYMDEDTIKEWRDARYTKRSFYGWYGIKPENRGKNKT